MLVQTLKTLYSPDTPDTDIYRILNDSRYITDIRKGAEIPILLNTGFRFSTHLGKFMDLYFDLYNKEVIRTPESPLFLKPPQLLGFIGTIRDTQYIDHAVEKICVQINNAEYGLDDSDDILMGLGIVDLDNIDDVISNGSKLSSIAIIDAEDKKLDYSTFIIYGDGEPIQLPLRKSFGDLVYFDGSRFSKNNPDYEEYDY